jgi:hypothetical protein
MISHMCGPGQSEGFSLGDRGRMSLRGGSVRGQGGGSPRSALLLVSGVPISWLRNRGGRRAFPQGRHHRVRSAKRLRLPGRQRRDHASALLRAMRHAGVQRSGRAADAHFHSRRHARRSQSGRAHRDHLVRFRAHMGVLRSQSAQDRGTAATVEGLTGPSRVAASAMIAVAIWIPKIRILCYNLPCTEFDPRSRRGTRR